VCRTQCATAGVSFSSEIVQDDFIQYSRHQFENSLFEAEPKTYTHAILNPPYKKIGSRSEQRAALSSLGIETGNLYSAFTALALKWLRSKGELVAITPRSFCNGSYFKPFRRYLFEQASLRQIHVFERRNRAFSDDDVLQENIIFHLIKEGSEGRVVISSSSGTGWDVLTKRDVSLSQVVDVRSSERIIHIASNEFDQELVDQMRAFPCSLNDLDFSVSTGRVVDFRSKQYLQDKETAETVSLIYPGHMKDGFVEHPQDPFKKCQFIELNSETVPLFFRRELTWS
jgi:adenine-specific DNA-methyltransferase